MVPPPARTTRTRTRRSCSRRCSTPDYTPAGWVPKFADYLALSFWTSTAFSPTDISAIKRWAKLLMMTESTVSLGIGTLVIARAINIVK